MGIIALINRVRFIQWFESLELKQINWYRGLGWYHYRSDTHRGADYYCFKVFKKDGWYDYWGLIQRDNRTPKETIERQWDIMMWEQTLSNED
jgi:hypothetical protein